MIEPTAAAEADALRACVQERLTALGPALARSAFAAGLAVRTPEGASQPIPVGALPVVLASDEIARRARLAHRLLSATAKAARWRLGDPTHRALVLEALGPAERRLVLATWQDDAAHGVARVDGMGEPWQAVEVNATIPAMQGYSDIAAREWLRHIVPAAAAMLAGRNGSNAQALLDALRGLHARRRDGELRHVAILCRAGDAQLGELEHLQGSFAAAGVEAGIVHPGRLHWDGAWLRDGTRPLDLVYRHLFVHRLETMPDAALEAAWAAGAACRTTIANRPAPHLEMKSTLALLSCVADVPARAAALGLDDEEREAIRSAVPWTRAWGFPDDDPASWFEDVLAHPDDYVLKRNWSYGGRDVFVGRARHTPEFAARASAAFDGEATAWRTLCQRAAADRRGGGFVVQRAVPAPRTPQWLCTPGRVQTVQTVTDYAAYASLGVAPAWGGVCRAAGSDVVNIVGGGGVVPLLRAEVARGVLEALRHES